MLYSSAWECLKQRGKHSAFEKHAGPCMSSNICLVVCRNHHTASPGGTTRGEAQSASQAAQKQAQPKSQLLPTCSAARTKETKGAPWSLFLSSCSLLVDAKTCMQITAPTSFLRQPVPSCCSQVLQLDGCSPRYLQHGTLPCSNLQLWLCVDIILKVVLQRCHCCSIAVIRSCLKTSLVFL